MTSLPSALHLRTWQARLKAGEEPRTRPWSSLPGGLVTAPNRKNAYDPWDEWGPFLASDGTRISVTTRRWTSRQFAWRAGELGAGAVLADEVAATRPEVAAAAGINAAAARFGPLLVWDLACVNWGDVAVQWRRADFVASVISPALGLCARWDGDPFGELRRAKETSSLVDLAALHTLAGTTPTTSELLAAANELAGHQVLLVTTPT